MLWHCASWPGRLADLCSEKSAIIDKRFTDLLEDYRIFTVACDKSSNNPVLKKLLPASPFNTRVMREIVLMLTADHDATMDERKALVVKYARMIFASWGQTKICEDTFKELRDREQRDTCNQYLSVTSYHAFMTNMKTIELHKRDEPQPDKNTPLAKIDPKEAFYLKKHTPADIDSDRITARACWPTFTPQSSKRIYADLALFRHCDKTDSWDNISRAWQTTLFCKGMLIYKKSVMKYAVVLGDVQSTMLLVWEVSRVQLGKTNNACYVLARDKGSIDHLNKAHIIWDALELQDYVVVPAVPVSPIHFWVAMKKKASQQLGIVMLQTGAPTTVMKYAAQHCFHQLDLGPCNTICAEHGVSVDGPPSLPRTLTALIRKFLDPISDDEILAILALRSVEPENPMEILTDEACEQMLDSTDLQTLAEHLKKVQAQRAEAGAFREAVSTGNAGVTPSSKRPEAKDKVISVKLSLANAKLYCPPHTVLFHCPNTHRIRGYYCFGGARPSHGCLLAHGQDIACRVVLAWLWERHLRAHPTATALYTFPTPSLTDEPSQPSKGPVVSEPASSSARRLQIKKGGPATKGDRRAYGQKSAENRLVASLKPKAKGKAASQPSSAAEPVAPAGDEPLAPAGDEPQAGSSSSSSSSSSS